MVDDNIQVEEIYENDRLTLKITSDKTKAHFTVSKKPGNPTMWHVDISKGVLPAILSGRYTTPGYAEEAVKKYIQLSKPSPTVVRDIKAENRRIRKENLDGESSTKSDSKDDLQQGVLN